MCIFELKINEMTKKIFLILVTLTNSCLFAQGAWTQKANVGGTTRTGAVGFSINGKGYIGTGGTNVNPPTLYQDFWEWDPITNIWTQKANFGGGVRCNGVGFSIGTKGYIGTGTYDFPSHNPQLKTKDFWEWDQGTNVWERKADFPGSARDFAIGFSIGNKGYIGTGINNDLWEWDQNTDTWTQKASLPVAKDAATAFSIGNKGYIVCGDNLYSGRTQEFWEWDQSTDTWAQKASFPGAARDGAVGFSIGTKGYIGTGSIGYPNMTTDFWEWDQSTDTWAQSINFGGLQRVTAIGFSIGGKGYIGTGGSSYPNCYKDFWEFDPMGSNSIKEPQISPRLRVFPNPAANQITIIYTASYTQKLFLTIKNALGQTVYTDNNTNFSGTYNKTVDLGYNSKGIYFVEIICGNECITNKILLE